MAKQIGIEFVGKDVNVKEVINSINNNVSKMSTNIGSALKLGVAGGVAFLANSLKNLSGSMYENFKSDEQGLVKLEQVILATGRSAGYSKSELVSYANELSKITTFASGETVNAMSVLATYTKISGENFKIATEQAMNMSTIFGGDLNSSINMIGKALNNPAEGLSKLTKVGVTFTESEKEKIKVLSESGRVTEAQTLMLKVLESQIGGTAKEVGRSASGAFQSFTNSLNDIGSELVGKVMPILQDFTPLLRIVAENIAIAVEKIGLFVQSMYEMVKSIIQSEAYVSFFDKLKNYIINMYTAVKSAVMFFVELSIAIKNLVNEIPFLASSFEVLKTVVEAVYDVVNKLLTVMSSLFKSATKELEEYNNKHKESTETVKESVDVDRESALLLEEKRAKYQKLREELEKVNKVQKESVQVVVKSNEELLASAREGLNSELAYQEMTTAEKLEFKKKELENSKGDSKEKEKIAREIALLEVELKKEALELDEDYYQREKELLNQSKAYNRMTTAEKIDLKRKEYLEADQLSTKKQQLAKELAGLEVKLAEEADQKRAEMAEKRTLDLKDMVDDTRSFFEDVFTAMLDNTLNIGELVIKHIKKIVARILSELVILTVFDFLLGKDSGGGFDKIFGKIGSFMSGGGGSELPAIPPPSLSDVILSSNMATERLLKNNNTNSVNGAVGMMAPVQVSLNISGRRLDEVNFRTNAEARKYYGGGNPYAI